MKSKLNITQFRNRIKENTKIGSPKFKLSLFGGLTIFGDNSKLFYGLIDDSNFRLTANATLSPTLYIIVGKYRSVNNELNINYTMEPGSKFLLAWVKNFPFIALFAVNIFFLLILKKVPIEVFIIFNLFIVFVTLFSRWDIKRKKKNLEQKFIEIFELVS